MLKGEPVWGCMNPAEAWESELRKKALLALLR